MRLLTSAAFFACLFCFQVFTCNDVEAQVRQAYADYHGDRVFRYQPSDPWVRSRMFNLHTGNGGLFYNCDGEQSKRNSPYICWKPHFENDFPPFGGLWCHIKEDVEAVRQRILDGSCCDTGCNSNACNCQQSGCATCSQQPLQQTHQQPFYSKSTPEESTIRQTRTRIMEAAHGSQYGLVKGKIVEPRNNQIRQTANPKNAPTSVANQSLLEQLRASRRR